MTTAPAHPTHDPAAQVAGLYEIINPSDAYTLRSPDFLTAAVAALFLGEGHYGLREIGGERSVPVFILGDPDVWTRETFGLSLEETLERGRPGVADVLDSVMIGRASVREAYETALRHLPEEKHAAYRAEVLEQQRTSLTNIGRRAWALAAHYRKGRS